MGIHGLREMVEPTLKDIHIQDLRGCTIAIDTYSWLYRGAQSCCRELCKGQPTTKYTIYCMKMVELLQYCAITPFLVFDGDILPMKIDEKKKRARMRDKKLAKAIKLESKGETDQAFNSYKKAIEVTPFMVYELIKILKERKISYIVAPYEADAQLAFLAKNERVHAVITDDTDLILFGCPRIIFSMEQSGKGKEFKYSTLLQDNRDFEGFSEQMVLEMSVLSGCDYLKSQLNISLTTVHQHIKEHKTYDKVIEHLRRNTKTKVPHTYEDSFLKAMLTYQHQTVYDPIRRDIVHLGDLPNDVDDDLEFLGPLMQQQLAIGIAEGDLNPITKAPFEEYNAINIISLDSGRRLIE